MTYAACGACQRKPAMRAFNAHRSQPHLQQMCRTSCVACQPPNRRTKTAQHSTPHPRQMCLTSCGGFECTNPPCLHNFSQAHLQQMCQTSCAARRHPQALEALPRCPHRRRCWYSRLDKVRRRTARQGFVSTQSGWRQAAAGQPRPSHSGWGEPTLWSSFSRCMEHSVVNSKQPLATLTL